MGVIHLCLPPSPEHYLQEIGRAGRDGRPAKAIALPLQDEFVSRHSLAHSDRVARSQLDVVFSGLQRVVDEALSDIPPDAGVDLGADELFVDGLHVAMPVTQTVDASDCKEESIETILSILEGDNSMDQSFLSVEGYLPDVATITLKKRSLDKLEKFEQIARGISMCGTRMDDQGQPQTNNQNGGRSFNRFQGDFGGTAMEKGFYAYSFGTYKFSVVRCARCMGPNTEPRHVYAALRRLQGNGELELALDTSPNGRALHMKMKREGIQLFRTKEGKSSSGGNGPELSDVGDEVGAVVTKLSAQFSAKEEVSVGKVQSMYDILHRVSRAKDAEDEGDDVGDEDDEGCAMSCQAKKSHRLITFQRLVQDYFSNRPPSSEGEGSEGTPTVIEDFPVQNSRLLSCLSSDASSLMQLLSQRRQEQVPGAVRVRGSGSADYRDLCLAKVLHGIDAPRAPLLDWYGHPLWGKYRSHSFSSLVRAVGRTFRHE